jgi:hypothetical protein
MHMRHRGGRLEPRRILALGNAGKPGRVSSDLRWCLVLLVGAITVFVLVVGVLALSLPLARGSSQARAERWLFAAIAFAAAALAFVSGRFFRQRSAELPRRRLVIDRNGIAFESGTHKSERVVDFARPFGLTLLGNGARDRIVLAVTTQERTLYLAAQAKPDDRRAHPRLVSWACTVADDDLVLDATGPDGKPLSLSLEDFDVLVQTLLGVDRGALDRCFLSDARGSPVVLDEHELRVGRKAFDLHAPLEWRATLFQEPLALVLTTNERDPTPSPGRGILVYQATWVRQGSSEAVLVSVLSSLPHVGASLPLAGEAPEIASAMLRDLRLMQATADSPPPQELRVAIEHVYMPRLRAALDRAPHASHKDIPSGTAAL